MNVHRHYPGCIHDTQPPQQPPNPGSATPASSIGMYIPILMLIAIILIFHIVKYKNNKDEKD